MFIHNYVDIVVMYSQSWFCFHRGRVTRSRTRKGSRSKYRIGIRKKVKAIINFKNLAGVWYICIQAKNYNAKNLDEEPQALSQDTLDAETQTLSQDTSCATGHIEDIEYFQTIDIPPPWVNVSTDTCHSDLHLCVVEHKTCEDSSPLVVTRSVVINKFEQTWHVHIHGNQVNPLLIPSLADIPDKLSDSTTSLLLSRITDLNICTGNPETIFVELGRTKKMAILYHAMVKL